jgi:hypothetical protein
MKMTCVKKINSPMRLVAAALIAGISFNPVIAAAQNPVPFKAMMQSAGAEPAVPPMPDTSKQTARAGQMTGGAKVEIGVGAFLIAAGATSLALTALLTRDGWGAGIPGKTAAGYAGGGAAVIGGVTLITLGCRKRPAK